LDYELPDPFSGMHFKKKRSGPIAMLGAVIAVGTLFLYPTLGLKLPQRDNPFFYRKKYGTPTTVNQMQEVALMEYAGNLPKIPESNVLLGPAGFQMIGNGIRIDLDNYNDLIC
jgi:hypothetical protein